MSAEFPKFGKIVATAFQAMAQTPQVFVVGVTGDDLYAEYLKAFPAGTDPIFKKRTEHDCSCCKQFIRRAGSVVTLKDGVLRTIWDEAAEKAPHPYNVVAARLRDVVLAADIVDLYRVSQKEGSFGAAETRSITPDSGPVITWNHFHTDAIPSQLKAASPDQVKGDYRTTVQVFERGLTELSPDALATVVSLIEANNLYRGEEHKAAVLAFQQAQQVYLSSPEARARHIFAWTNVQGSAARLRNSAIGTLVQDLSEGMDVEKAVKAFETKVAPTNYKRTTAVITPGMVKQAMKTIEELGLEPALERRFAVIGDISVKDVLWVDGAAKPLMKGGLGGMLMEQAKAQSAPSAKKDEERAEEIGLDAFVKTVLPEATGMEVLLKGEHLGNLMSLTAPVHPEPKQLFRWNNDFAWSYGGNVADSIKERVKQAGGKVEGCVLRVSLSWFNLDDLDLHVIEPVGGGMRSVGNHIFFRNKRGWTGGELDVDMNAGSGTTRQAVENIVWTRVMPDGVYKVFVNNYCRRESSNVGFVVEVESAGRLSHYSFNKGVRNEQNIDVVALHMKGGAIERVEIGDAGITPSNISQTKWGLTTEQYVKVNAVTLSPNYWGENKVGNKHTFFVLDGAKCDEPTRGIYNEFLHPRLEQHRKVFEVIGDKTKCQPTDGALSGLGFSSTKRDNVLVKVQQGKKQRLFNVQVG